jgi:hypothetical protein
VGALKAAPKEDEVSIKKPFGVDYKSLPKGRSPKGRGGKY